MQVFLLQVYLLRVFLGVGTSVIADARSATSYMKSYKKLENKASDNKKEEAIGIIGQDNLNTFKEKNN